MCKDITPKGSVVPVFLIKNDSDMTAERQGEQDAIQTQRRAVLSAEADPLFFKWQRGEATEQEWLDKVQQIRERYPENNEGEK